MKMGSMHTVVRLISDFQNGRSRSQLTRMTDWLDSTSFSSGFVLKALLMKRHVSQLTLQPRVPVKRMREASGGRRR